MIQDFLNKLPLILEILRGTLYATLFTNARKKYDFHKNHDSHNF